MKENDLTHCEYIYSNYRIIKNNSHNEYGTSVFNHNELPIENLRCDMEGRIIVFNTGDSTIVNVYPKAGLDGESR